jgi:predicted nucleic acid-binding protein
MIVVADSTPLIALVNIGHIELLQRMFGAVIIPATVAKELTQPRRPKAVQEFVGSPPRWLSVRAATSIEAIPGIHEGECEAISLARELHADLLLIDDADGREAAIQRGIATVRTLRLLTDAANRSMIDLREAFDRLTRTNFRLNQETLDTLLAEHLAKQQGS